MLSREDHDLKEFLFVAIVLLQFQSENIRCSRTKSKMPYCYLVSRYIIQCTVLGSRPRSSLGSLSDSLPITRVCHFSHGGT